MKERSSRKNYQALTIVWPRKRRRIEEAKQQYQLRDERFLEEKIEAMERSVRQGLRVNGSLV